MKKSRITLILWVLILMVSVVACGGDEPAAPAATSPPAQLPAATQPPAATAAPAATEAAPAATEPAAAAPGASVATLEQVQNAVIQIVAQGSFMDPEVGQVLNAAGAGSGFIIDPSGIAVTNNHVVTGAATLEIFLQGEEDSRNARVLGVSECSDLAVIDIDGDGFPFLTWREDPVTVGLDVYAAGFPLGDPEFTLTRGIISKEDADGETNWASVDKVLEHDATINPGNSGGALVDANGQLVGVNYAGASGVDQYFAISRDEAMSIIEQLRNETDVTSIGINGTAVNNGEGLSGIWVSSVESGSPADEAGIQAGDIITTIEGLVLATDGTMKDYCDVLRSRSADDVMDVEVLRFATGEVLQGQLNGDELAVTVSFADALQDEVAPADESAGGGEGGSFYTYVPLTDDTGTLYVEVPDVWTDTNGGPWTGADGAELGLSVSASPDLFAFGGGWDTPGMFFGASDQLGTDPNALLDTIYGGTSDCQYDGRFEYSDPLYTGYYDQFSNCGGIGTLYISLAVTPEDASYIILVNVQAVTEADLEALDQILNTFIVSLE